MVSEDKIAVFLKLQQIVLDIDTGADLLDRFLPVVFQQISALGSTYNFLSAIFIDTGQKIKKTYLVDRSNHSGD